MPKDNPVDWGSLLLSGTQANFVQAPDDCVDDWDLEQLAEGNYADKIRRLDLTNQNNVSILGVGWIKKLPLTYLGLSNTGSGTDALRVLSGGNIVKTLLDLDISCTSQTNHSMYDLCAFTKLKGLDVSYNDLSNDFLSVIANSVRGLTYLSLAGNYRITGRTLGQLATVGVKELNLSSTGITDALLGNLQGVPLIGLKISNTHITSQGFGSLVGLSLQSLQAANMNSQLDIASMKKIGEMRQLVQLNVTGGAFSAGALGCLLRRGIGGKSDVPPLETLNLSYCRNVVDRDLEFYVYHFLTTLQEIVLSGTATTQEGRDALQRKSGEVRAAISVKRGPAFLSASSQTRLNIVF